MIQINENLRNVYDANDAHSDNNAHYMAKIEWQASAHLIPPLKIMRIIQQNGGFRLKSEIVSKSRASVKYILNVGSDRHSLAYSI